MVFDGRKVKEGRKAISDDYSTEVIINGKKITIKAFYKKHKRGDQCKTRMGMRQKKKPSPMG